jgi:hypothetical protein
MSRAGAPSPISVPPRRTVFYAEASAAPSPSSSAASSLPPTPTFLFSPASGTSSNTSSTSTPSQSGGDEASQQKPVDALGLFGRRTDTVDHNRKMSLEWTSKSGGTGFIVLEGMSQDELKGMNR